jgi:hypothetical protein
MPVKKILTAALAVIIWLSGAAALAAAPDVGLVTGLSGEVTYRNQAEKQPQARAQAFLKIRLGDQLKLTPGSGVQLLYFSSGVQETWKGPVTLQVGDMQSQAVAKPPFPPEVKVISAKVASRMAGAPLNVARAGASGACREIQETTRSSGVIPTMGARPASSPQPTPALRTAQTPKEVAEAERLYQNLKKQAKPDDLTLEIYLLSVYAEREQYQKMESLIDIMLTKRPGDETLKGLKARVKARMPLKTNPN